MKPTLEYLANRVSVNVRLRRGGDVRHDTNVHLLVDRDGHVDLDTRFMRGPGVYDAAVDFLRDEGIAEFRPVGPEDSELFLTQEWADLLAPQLLPLKSWQTVRTYEPEEVTP